MSKVQGRSLPEWMGELKEITPDQAWCFIGATGSGIGRLGEVWCSGADTALCADSHGKGTVGYVSFRRQQEIYEEELKKDDTDFMDRIDPGTPARAFLSDIEHHRELITLFALDRVLDQGFRELSTGQSRKLLMLQHITQGVQQLVLEEPYEGLDQRSCIELNEVLARLFVQGVGLVILVRNEGDIPSWCTHLGVIGRGQLTCGLLEAMKPRLHDLLDRPTALFHVTVEELRGERRLANEEGRGNNLIVLQHGFARYGEVEVFNGLDLRVARGEHTLITGPNGCGKSTLLKMITGDHPLCYVNDLQLFGKRRGSGESIWELKQRMGIVSADLHRNYRVSGSTLAAVLSGLYDSIGLYTRPGTHEQQLGRRWLARLDMEHYAQTPFRQLDYGNQRLVLLARALIKVPELLVLDEPTQGLDDAHREALLNLLAAVAQEGLCTLLYVSHRRDEFRSFFKRRVDFS